MVDTSIVSDNYIENAQVTLFENGNLVGSVYHTHFSSYGYLSENSAIPNYYLPTYVPKKGNEYKVKVEVPGYPDMEATTIIPKPVNVQVTDTFWYREEHFVWDSVNRTTIPGKSPMLGINIQFTDPANQENFYLLEMDLRLQVEYSDTKVASTDSNIEFDSNNPIYEINIHHGTMPFGKAFTDKAISGKTMRLKVEPAWGSTDTPQLIFPSYGVVVSARQTFYVKLYSITEDYYLYLKTLNKYNENRKSPFYPPIQVHSNIKGGLGIFAGAGISKDSVSYNITKWY